MAEDFLWEWDVFAENKTIIEAGPGYISSGWQTLHAHMLKKNRDYNREKPHSESAMPQ